MDDKLFNEMNMGNIVISFVPSKIQQKGHAYIAFHPEDCMVIQDAVNRFCRIVESVNEPVISPGESQESLYQRAKILYENGMTPAAIFLLEHGMGFKPAEALAYCRKHFKVNMIYGTPGK